MNGMHRLRLALGLSQTQFGRELGVTGGAVAHWERGRFVPRASIVTEICQRWGALMAEESIRPLDLIGGTRLRGVA